MKIYTAENDIAQLILSNRSISCESILSAVGNNELETFHNSLKTLKLDDQVFWSKASLNDSDLYYRKSIFVTTAWNKNDDVFDPEEVWVARNTPSHKPTNIGHKESDIVGHITSTWATTKDGQLIPDNAILDNLPEFYHLINGSVIYTAFEDKEMKSRSLALIADIEAGKKYVSMETVFGNFDYAVLTPEGEKYIVGRNKDTAFLTKQLRAYSGSGQFDGCKVGRLLRGITFTGKGYVDKPANPYSIIFAESDSLNFSKAVLQNPFKTSGGVYINMNNLELENNKMSEGQKTSIESATATLIPAIDIGQVVNGAVSKAFASEKSIAELNDKVVTLTSELEVSKAECSKLTADRDALSKTVADLQSELTTIKANQVRIDRVSLLTGKGVDKAIAEAKVDVLVGLNDQQFDLVAEDIVKANVKAVEAAANTESTSAKKDEDEEEDDEEMESDASAKAADTALIDKAVAEAKDTETITPNSNPAASAETDRVTALRNEIVEAIKSKKKSK